MTTKTNGKLIPAAGYVRMSGDHQEGSPAQQREEIAALAEKEGCMLVDEYYDEAISGSGMKKRKGFLQMVADAQAGKFTTILAWDQARLSRATPLETNHYYWLLQQAGIRVVTVAQGDLKLASEEIGDCLGREVVGYGQRKYLRDLSRNVVRGKEAACRNGRYLGRIPFGYARAIFDESGKEVQRLPRNAGFTKPKTWTGKLIVSEDPREVELVKWLFTTYSDTDTGLATLARKLNIDKVPTPDNARKWHHSTLEAMLTNRAYIGTYTFGVKKLGNFNTTKGITQIENTHEPLIDRKTFDRVQQKIKDRKLSKRRDRGTWTVLVGVLRCGHCGSPLYGVDHDEGRNRYYLCSGVGEFGCRAYSVRQDFIEPYLRQLVQERFGDPATLDALRKRLLNIVTARQTTKPTDVKALRAKIAKLESQIRTGARNVLMAKAKDIPELSEVLNEWRDERDRLESELAALGKSPVANPQKLVSAALRNLDTLVERSTSKDPAVVREAFGQLFESVRLWWERPHAKNFWLVRGEVTFKPPAGIQDKKP